MSKEKRGHRTGTLLRPPAHNKKKFSDGVRATFKSIRKVWERGKGQPPALRTFKNGRSVEDFVEDFASTFKAMQQHYGAIKPNRNIVKLVENIEMGETELPFYQERAYSGYVGLPTGVLMLFTNTMSDATQRHTKQSVLNLLSSSLAAIEALRAHIDQAPDLKDALYLPVKEGEEGLEYIAKLEGLLKMVEVFQALRIAEQTEAPPAT